MSLRVLKAGIFDTIQDNGRTGFSKWGVNPGGAMDRYALRISNALLGNSLEEAAIELHFPASQFLIESDLLISICGADFSAEINAQPLPLWKPLWARAGSVITFSNKKQGNRAYLSVLGGFDLKPWLGSLSTNTKIEAGGMEGRILKKDDILETNAFNLKPILPQHDQVFVFPWYASHHFVYQDPEQIFFIEGNEWDWLSDESKFHFEHKVFEIDPSSDRMAFHLNGEPLFYKTRTELLSSAVSFGTIQGLPSGKLMTLMADHQTTGGYPKIGHVISAHLPKLAQLNARQPFKFKKIKFEEAEKMLFSLEQDIRTIAGACKVNLRNFYNQ